VTMPTTTVPSWLWIAWKTARPRPGMLKMPSVTTAPDSSAPRSAPRKVTTGIRLLRSVCLPTTDNGVRPFALAVRT